LTIATRKNSDPEAKEEERKEWKTYSKTPEILPSCNSNIYLLIYL
jgi:hypothetical protein